MSQRVAFFDIAGTIVASDPWKYLLVDPRISRRRIRGMQLRILPIWLGVKIGAVSDATFRHHWIHRMASVLKDWTQTEVWELFERVANEMQDEYLDDVVARVAQHKQNGDRVVLVSGMFRELADAIGRRIGADTAIGTEMAYQNGVCTGKIAGATCNGTRKVDFIRDYLAANGFPSELSEHYGYADSTSDVPLLSAVGHPTATYPDKQLAALAQQRGWPVLPVHSS